MDSTKLSYGKAAPDLELREQRYGSVPKNEYDKMPVDETVVPDTYKKFEGKRSAALIFVISGGEVRERDFLRELIQQERPHSLKVAFFSKEKQGLQPNQMQEYWLKVRKEKILEVKGQKYSLLSADKVYLLTDVDEYYEQLVGIVGNQSEEDTGQWIISNPCFEIWLYYCFANNPCGDLSILETLDTKKRSKELKRLGNVKVKGGLNPRKAFEKMKEGIVHSAEHYKEDENSIPCLFSTQMHVMARFIIDTMNNNAKEYDKLLKEKAGKREEWKEKLKDTSAIL